MMFYSKPDYSQHMHFNVKWVPDVDILWSVKIMAVTIAYLLQLIPLLTEREPITKHSIQGLAELVFYAQRVGAITSDFLDNIVSKDMDIVSKVWTGEIVIPDDPKKRSEFFEKLLRN